MKGVFELKDHNDLLAKLEREYARVQTEPLNSDFAFNFIVTAWHMLEWVYPGDQQKSARDTVRDSSPALQICEHLSVGAKHFEPRDGRLKSVSSSGKGDVWGRAWGNAWGNSWKTWLEVRLSGKAAKKYGSVIKLQDLAREVMEFWRSFTFPQ